MKIKEVCRRTGLTERTVRYWASEGLISPATYELNERSYFDFSEADIALLDRISTLRRAGFSVGEVAEMQKDPSSIPARVLSLRETLQTQAAEQEKSAEALAGLEDCTNLDSLAQRLAASAESRPLPELDPHFGRFDLVTAEERQERYAEFQQDSANRSRKKQLIAVIAGAVLLVIVSVFSTLAATGQLPEITPRPVPGWEVRISGDFTPPFAVSGLGDAKVLKSGTDSETGKPVILLSAEGRELTLFFRRVGAAEREFITAADEAWQPAPNEGAHDAVCYLPAGEDVYEVHAVCEGLKPEALPEFLGRNLKITAESYSHFPQ